MPTTLVSSLQVRAPSGHDRRTLSSNQSIYIGSDPSRLLNRRELRLRVLFAAGLFCAFLALDSRRGFAAELQVAPISIEVQAPGASATLKLRNVGKAPLNAQIRVFRWSQVNGEEKLEPTTDVVASPPITTLAPGTEYVARVVRVTKQPISHGESYRLLVDELPDSKAPRTSGVTLVLRYSLPVFFYPRDAAAPKLTWSTGQLGGRLYVSAQNDGDRHARIAALKVRDGSGSTVSFGNGLTGYVLGQSTMRWLAPKNMSRLGSGNSVMISAEADFGQINASPVLPTPR